jgi:hypothetical protein
MAILAMREHGQDVRATPARRLQIPIEIGIMRIQLSVA